MKTLRSESAQSVVRQTACKGTFLVGDGLEGNPSVREQHELTPDSPQQCKPAARSSGELTMTRSSYRARTIKYKESTQEGRGIFPSGCSNSTLCVYSGSKETVVASPQHLDDVHAPRWQPLTRCLQGCDWFDLYPAPRGPGESGSRVHICTIRINSLLFHRWLKANTKKDGGRSSEMMTVGK